MYVRIGEKLALKPKVEQVPTSSALPVTLAKGKEDVTRTE